MNDEKMTVGTKLKTAREARSRSLDEMACELCLRRNFLEAIERDDISALPEPTFAAGFVRSYAKALGMDGAAMAADFRAEHGLSVAQPIVIPPQMAAPKSALPRWLSSTAGLALALGAWFTVSSGLATYQTAEVLQHDREAIERAELDEVKSRLAETSPDLAAADSAVTGSTEAVPANPGPSAPVMATAAPLEQPADARPFFARRAPPTSIFPAAMASEGPASTLSPNALMISATEDSWVRLEGVDGTEVWSGVLKEGETFRPAVSGSAIFLTTSNAGGVSISFQNQALGPLGERGEIIAGLRLDASRVPATQG